MAEWSTLLTVAIPAGSLLVAAATFWTSRQSRNAQTAKEESQKQKDEKAQALAEARETGRREALRLVEETRQSELLTEVENAGRLLGSPADMARWKESVERALRVFGSVQEAIAWKERVDQILRAYENLDEWQRIVEARQAEVDSRGSFRAARDDTRGGENTPAPITPQGRRRR